MWVYVGSEHQFSKDNDNFCSAGDHFRQVFGPYAGWAHSVSKELMLYFIVLVMNNCRYCSVLI